jgi:hypothetical protein
MITARGMQFVLLCALAGLPANNFALAQSSSPPTAQPTGQTTPPQTAPKKKPSKPIDPDETAGVRGSGSPLTVRVLMRGKTVENAHVVVKNTNGSLAGSCFTSAAGDCKVEVGADDYEINAVGNGRTGTLKLHVSADTGIVSIKLLTTKTAAPVAKP